MRMIQRPGISQKQKMSRRTVIVVAAATSSVLAIIAVLFFVFNIGNIRHGFAASSLPKMDARWTVVSNTPTRFTIKLSIHSSSEGENIGSANYIFTYNTKNLSFPLAPASGSDYEFINFNAAPYKPGTVTQPNPGLIFINIHSPGGTGTSVSGGYVDVCTITFNKLKPYGNADINWKMNSRSASKLDDVFDDRNNSFDIGTFTGIMAMPGPAIHISLSATITNDQTQLNWSTSSEQNTAYFTIQRSKDRVSFDSIQSKTSLGASQAPQDYTDNDDQPLAGTSFYRVILTDLDGGRDTSNIVSVTRTNSGINNQNATAENFAITSISPTTFQDHTNVNYTMPENGNPRMMIVSMNGKTIADIQVPSVMGENTYQIQNASMWEPGVYVVSMYYNGQSTFAKMIKQ